MYRNLFLFLLVVQQASLAQPVIRHAITVAGSQVYAEENGHGEALILLHAGNMDHRMWEAQVAPFSKHFRVISCDLRGCGLTQDGDSTYLQSDALLAVMDSLHIQQASFVGVSLGAVAATDFALAHAGRVKKLILVSPGLIGLDLNHDSALVRYSRQMEVAYKKGDTLAYTELFIRAWADGPHRRPGQVDSAFRRKAFAMAHENVAKRKPGVHPGLTYEPSQLQQLPQLRMPMLVITGAEDMIDIHMIAQEYKKHGARLVVIPNAAHMVNMERPVAFNRLVLDFLSAQ